MNYLKDTKKGRYIVQNPHKYIGSKHPVFKSKWEQQIFFMLDHNPFIKKWGYECQPIPYFNKVTNKQTVYYPDIFFHRVDDEGNHLQFLVEIKPFKFARPPEMPKRKTPATMNRYKKQQAAYLINLCKWEEAEKWCTRHRVQWMILTEKNCKKFTANRNN